MYYFLNILKSISADKCATQVTSLSKYLPIHLFLYCKYWNLYKDQISPILHIYTNVISVCVSVLPPPPPVEGPKAPKLWLHFPTQSKIMIMIQVISTFDHVNVSPKTLVIQEFKKCSKVFVFSNILIKNAINIF